MNAQISEIYKLKQKRDELRLQAHLFNAELKDEWKKLENDWKVLEPKIKQSFSNLNDSLKTLINDLHAAYDRLLKQKH